MLLALSGDDVDVAAAAVAEQQLQFKFALTVSASSAIVTLALTVSELLAATIQSLLVWVSAKPRQQSRQKSCSATTVAFDEMTSALLVRVPCGNVSIVGLAAANCVARRIGSSMLKGMTTKFVRPNFKFRSNFSP